MMPSWIRSPFRNARLVAAVLSIFLFGSNYCVLAAVASGGPGAARLSCHAETPARGADHGCCHRAPHRDGAPAPRAAYPCCIQIAPPSTSGDFSRPVAPMALVVAAPAPAVVPPAPALFAELLDRHGGAPLDGASAPSRGRAPPIS